MKQGVVVSELYQSGDEWGYNIINGADSYANFKLDFRNLDRVDILGYVQSNTGSVVGILQTGLNQIYQDNKKKHRYSYKAQKKIKKLTGKKIRTRELRSMAKNGLNNASRKITVIGGVLAVGDVLIDGELRASHVLNTAMVGVSAIPGFGWIVGGAYFLSDMITLGVTGKTIGQHLDEAVGAPLIENIYD